MVVERIQVLDRAVQLISLIAEGGSVSIADLSRQTGLALSTVARIVGALASHGIVERTTARQYRLGLRLVALASQVAPTRSLVEIARASMLELARTSGEDAGLAVLQNRQAVIIDWVYGLHNLKIIEPFSQTVTLNCAFRKILLAYKGDSWIKKYITETQFPAYTQSTLIDPHEIWEEVQLIRKRQLAISRAENIKDAGSVAAPIFAATGELAATIFVTCPLSRFNEHDVERLSQSVIAAGRTVSRKLKDAGLSCALLTNFNSI